MKLQTGMVLATLAGTLVAGSACTDKGEHDAPAALTNTVDTLKTEGNRALDAGNRGTTAVIDDTHKAVSETGEAITDSWITTKVHARFVGDALLKGSDISVDTVDHVVTLKGTVASTAGKAQAADVAEHTEGVRRVVNRIVVQ